MRMTAKIYLWLMILMSFAFGVLYLFVPTKMTDPMGYGVLAAAAVTDIRSMFGGFQIAMGLFLLWCLRPERIRIGLMCVFLGALGFVLCRGYGLYVDGEITPMLRGTILFESALTIISIVLYLFTPGTSATAASSDAPRGARIFASIVGVAMFVSGVLSVAMPMQMLAPMGFENLTPAALTDARASYGGFQIGFALFVLWCLKTRHLFAGVLNIVISFGLVAICRAIGLMLDGAFTQALVGAVVFEIVLTALAVWMLRQIPQSSHARAI